MYQLIRDSDGEVLFEGNENDCLGEFHKLTPFSYSSHKQYSFSKFTIKKKD